MARPKKATSVAELTEHFRNSSAAVLTEYRGLSVAQLKSLRRTLGSTVTYAVVKNTLTKIAAKQAGVTGVDDLLAGPSAIAFVSGDAVDAAKVIRNFSKDNPALVIKGGFMDGAALTAADINKLADLESREVLLSKLAAAMKAKQSQAAALFAAPLSKTARALGALQAKIESDPAAATSAATEVSSAELVEEPPAQSDAGIGAASDDGSPNDAVSTDEADSTDDAVSPNDAVSTDGADSATEADSPDEANPGNQPTEG